MSHLTRCIHYNFQISYKMSHPNKACIKSSLTGRLNFPDLIETDPELRNHFPSKQAPMGNVNGRQTRRRCRRWMTFDTSTADGSRSMSRKMELCYTHIAIPLIHTTVGWLVVGPSSKYTHFQPGTRAG